MNIDGLRAFCLSFPKATEGVQWGADLVFKVGGKMFAVINLEPPKGGLFSFKCSPEEFAELTEREGVIPAPYAARYHWVTVQDVRAVSPTEVRRLVRKSYDMARAKLPKKTLRALRLELPAGPRPRPTRAPSPSGSDRP